MSIKKQLAVIIMALSLAACAPVTQTKEFAAEGEFTRGDRTAVIVGISTLLLFAVLGAYLSANGAPPPG